MKKFFVWLLIISLVILLNNCSSTSSNNNKNNNFSKEIQKVSEKDVESTTKERKEKEEKKKSKNDKNNKIECKWILVLKTNSKIRTTEREKILKAIKDKWFKNKKVKVVSPEDYKMEDFIGKIVVYAEANYQYGEYDFNIRTDEIKEEDGSPVAYPVEENAPNGGIRGQETLGHLIKEIKYME